MGSKRRNSVPIHWSSSLSHLCSFFCYLQVRCPFCVTSCHIRVLWGSVAARHADEPRKPFTAELSAGFSHRALAQLFLLPNPPAPGCT